MRCIHSLLIACKPDTGDCCCIPETAAVGDRAANSFEDAAYGILISRLVALPTKSISPASVSIFLAEIPTD